MRGDLALPLLALELEEARLEDAHRDLAVLVLAALVLALDHDARREVGDPDRRVGLVDVLPAPPRGPVGVDLQVLLVYPDLDGVGDDRATATEAKLVCLREPASNGLILTSRCTPRSAERSPKAYSPET
jgi:hypothetical protein